MNRFGFYLPRRNPFNWLTDQEWDNLCAITVISNIQQTIMLAGDRDGWLRMNRIIAYLHKRAERHCGE